nr:MAG: hypothetical protein DIU80_03635 [Chloroflexota bacterium]
MPSPFTPRSGRGLTNLLLFLILGVLLSSQARAQSEPPTLQALAGTGFTYQGELKNASGLVNATCDFQFSLWDAPSAGAQLGATQAVTGVSVSEGLFTVQLNGAGQFGASAFSGQGRWLQIAVRCPGDTVFTTLSPRQPISATPYALAMPGLRTEQNATSANIVGGAEGNSVTAGVVGATLSGGGADSFLQQISDDYGTIGGGRGNSAGDGAGTASDAIGATVGGGEGNAASNSYTTVGGGQGNQASGPYATISGGLNNSADLSSATVGGGEGNQASNSYATVGGGEGNTATGAYATIPGGQNNSAGPYSMAAGRRAKALNTGSFVWADSTDADFSSTADNQFAIRAANGMFIANDAGGAKVVPVGTRYRDNSIVAWARVTAAGGLDTNFNVASVARCTNNMGVVIPAGCYRFTLNSSLSSGFSLVPIVTIELDPDGSGNPPAGVANVRFVATNQVAAGNTFDVYIYNSSFALVDNDFQVLVTGR